MFSDKHKRSKSKSNCKSIDVNKHISFDILLFQQEFIKKNNKEKYSEETSRTSSLAIRPYNIYYLLDYMNPVIA